MKCVVCNEYDDTLAVVFNDALGICELCWNKMDPEKKREVEKALGK